MNKYQRLVTAYHQSKPKFNKHIQLITTPFVDLQRSVSGFVDVFDIDKAVGEQLDLIGLWVGIGRHVRIPIKGIYFSLDTEGVGLNQGVWKREYDAGAGFTELDDETYRMILYVKIAANRWDGTVEMLNDIYQGIFPGGQAKIFVVDNFNMSMSVYIAGDQISEVMKAIISQGYLNVKPSGVRVTNYIISTQEGPLFGFDAQTEYVSGFEVGSWGQELIQYD